MTLALHMHQQLRHGEGEAMHARDHTPVPSGFSCLQLRESAHARWETCRASRSPVPCARARPCVHVCVCCGAIARMPCITPLPSPNKLACCILPVRIVHALHTRAMTPPSRAGVQPGGRGGWHLCWRCRLPSHEVRAGCPAPRCSLDGKYVRCAIALPRAAYDGTAGSRNE